MHPHSVCLLHPLFAGATASFKTGALASAQLIIDRHHPLCTCGGEAHEVSGTVTEWGADWEHTIMLTAGMKQASGSTMAATWMLAVFAEQS